MAASTVSCVASVMGAVEAGASLAAKEARFDERRLSLRSFCDSSLNQHVRFCRGLARAKRPRDCEVVSWPVSASVDEVHARGDEVMMMRLLLGGRAISRKVVRGRE